VTSITSRPVARAVLVARSQTVCPPAQLHDLADASDLVAQKQHLIDEPHYELVVARIILRDEHPLRFLTAKFSNDRQHAIALLTCPLFMHFVEIEHGVAPNGRPDTLIIT
jgi:hypothetical protein